MRAVLTGGKGALVLACVFCLPPSLLAEEPVASQAQPSPDGRRVGRRFLTNFGRDLVGVVSKSSLKPLLLTAGAAGVSSLFDDNVQRYFSAERRARWLGDSGDQLGKPYVIAPLGLALYGIGRLDHHQRFRDATYDVAEVTLVEAAYSTLLKNVTRRERPNSANKLSFPSGHAYNAFAWATVGAHYYGWKLGVPGYALASFIGVSRMEKNAHHLSDVVAAAGLGYLTAEAVVRKNSEPLSATHTTRLSLAPLRDPHGQGVGLQGALAF